MISCSFLETKAMQSVALTIKQTFCASFLSLAVISFSQISLAVTVDKVPNPRQVNNGWVTDMADILRGCLKSKKAYVTVFCQ